MRIGVISDTHGHVQYTLEAVRMLQSLEVAEVIHCGDIGSPIIPSLLDDWTAHFVAGNVDIETTAIEAAIGDHGHRWHGRFAPLTLGGISIAVLHGDDTRRLHEAIHCGQWQVVCHGHTHVARKERLADCLVLNPGALYRARPHSLAILETDPLAASIVPL